MSDYRYHVLDCEIDVVNSDLIKLCNQNSEE